MSRDVDNRDLFEMASVLQERVDFLKGHIDVLNVYIRKLEALVSAQANTIDQLLDQKK